MNERAKITASHLARHAVVYLRPSSAVQVEHNRESTERQYALASKARELGWPAERICGRAMRPVASGAYHGRKARRADRSARQQHRQRRPRVIRFCPVGGGGASANV